MKQVYGADALQILPCQNGFIFVTKQEEYEGKSVIAYKLLDFERMTLSPVTRSVYLLTKFGQHFERFETDEPEKFLTVQTLFLPDHRLLTVHPDGRAAMLSVDGRTLWQGAFTYDGCGPGGLALAEDGFWVSFPDAGAVVRYALRHFRQDLRVGGHGAIPAPEGLYYSNETLLICSAAGKLLELDLRSFNLSEYHMFDEPVHRYIKYNANEIVLLDSGIYKL